MAPMLTSMGYNNNRIIIDNYSEKYILEQIKNSLTNNKPVILNEMDYIGMIENMDSRTNKGFPMYENLKAKDGIGIEGVESPLNKMCDHYVTITGLIIDYQTDIVWLRVQTWGKINYLRLDEFYDYNQSLPYGTLILFA